MFTTIISAEELQNHISESDWVVFDCRFNLADTSAGKNAYLEGHIPGAIYLDLDQDLSSQITPETGRHPLPDLERFVDRLAQAGVSNNTQVVVYDDCAGAMAARCWWLLRLVGHKAVAVLDGGLAAWQSLGGELNDHIPQPTSTAYTFSLLPNQNLTVAEVEQALDAQSIYLVDARAAERYRGEVEPIDPIAGHVPSALNRPLTDNLAEGKFKPAAQLREEWLSVLGSKSVEAVVHMCGSGVTACHNQLAMEIAGLSCSRVYSGSWSEWIRDPARPIATKS
ncbi:sulfurtransferase [Neptuniibacter sp. QD48_11]|uniref:sulfurtransferase n=1 Tax=unclassified Neptuniibacter TaxID=2630693 RepID=UPI0039F565E4